jgi:hypothetical protein
MVLRRPSASFSAVAATSASSLRWLPALGVRGGDTSAKEFLRVVVTIGMTCFVLNEHNTIQCRYEVKNGILGLIRHDLSAVVEY